MKTIQLNGQPYEVEKHIDTIGDLLEHFHLGERIVIVEHNRRVLSKEDHKATPLRAGDVVEIVHFVGGG
ncbi:MULTISPECIES: sulfur carrier protein ThiS [Thermoactinomyces]|jgi:sulfur carrier protein|uniref:Sulfur carrier protein ThiS n=1 Tax=Thermoactinomyces daqus TaxID=1329516 RepID=A0A7W1XC92_9BACL|nr:MULTISPECIES: sulfur carrier protein ThiS [Thermoactinomyces]MBA4543909.1 sulfur carrier protein ThiS [Thermoactinomyces daqus]MBH8597423.1 sulfur carrier protein ThiS [Thermoactinomyces sp. CICC 10523]MBH8602984.1 sulfur carrier protein ThiS [Thermoactinomyces sp. CICC 10522]MBH8607168.1 sulfur carrier protein ThiS [Thermoactinomyces sp. CICC 10521]